MNLMFYLTEIAGKFMNQLPEYDVAIEEIHHLEKKDKPSGTAITLAQILLNQLNRKKDWVLERNGNPESIEISAIRGPDVPGTHTVTFSSAVDTLEITHTAHSRMGFALGAIYAGEWLQGRTGVFNMGDLLKDSFTGL